MTKNEIDCRLALAIGYPAKRVRTIHGFVQVYNAWGRLDGPIQYNGWQRFDHTEPAVIWPIAEKFDAFPARFLGGAWYTSFSVAQDPEGSPATAAALAVIRYVEGKK